MTPATDAQIAEALKRLGNYRVRRAQTVALMGEPDGIAGSHLLALGLRETGLRNVEGGAKLVGGKWVALNPKDPDEAKLMDVGWTQISRRYHPEALRRMPAVKSGTWTPLRPGTTPLDGGCVPRFEDALQFTIRAMQSNASYAEGRGYREPVRFSIAAHNGGRGGAQTGYSRGDVDRFTTGGDYSEWVLDAKSRIDRWLRAHSGWRVT